MWFVRATAFACAAFFFVPSSASAGETAVDLGLGPLIGTHAEPGITDHIVPVPVPILALSHREANYEIFAEGLPISPSIQSFSGVDGLQTNLTFENVLARAYLLHDALSLGAGEAIYNQTTTYTSKYYYDNQIDASRVSGGRYEVAVQPFRNRGFRLSLDLEPVLHGTVHGFITPQHFHLPDEAETGSQTEVNLSFRRRNAITEFEYGVRYVNYVAHFTERAFLADKNTGFRPYVSFGVRFGRPSKD